MSSALSTPDLSSAVKTLSRVSKLLRFVPSGLGAHAAARRIISWNQPLPSVRLPQRLSGGAILELDLSDPAQTQAYLMRRYAPDIVALLSRFVPRGGVLIDVGANIGLITFSVGARRPDMSIVAFEPDPVNAQRWRRNLELNQGVRAVLEEAAIGAATGEAGLVRSDESGKSFIAPTGFKHGAKVPVVTLDAFAAAQGLSMIDALKVDAEGYEPLVFEGAALLLRERAIRVIVCELEDSLLERSGFKREDVLSLLSGYGYTARPIPPVAAQRFRRRSIEAATDVVFVPG
jgi:FkbM family methyltransferase